jgi:hypothetical protein
MILLCDYIIWTANVPMKSYEEIHRWLVYKAKEGRHIIISINMFMFRSSYALRRNGKSR